jgi:hypothetical protein
MLQPVALEVRLPQCLRFHNDGRRTVKRTDVERRNRFNEESCDLRLSCLVFWERSLERHSRRERSGHADGRFRRYYSSRHHLIDG